MDPSSKSKAAGRAFDALKADDKEAFTTAFEDMVALCTDDDDDEDEEFAGLDDGDDMAELSGSLGMAGM